MRVNGVGIESGCQVGVSSSKLFNWDVVEALVVFFLVKSICDLFVYLKEEKSSEEMSDGFKKAGLCLMCYVFCVLLSIFREG